MKPKSKKLLDNQDNLSQFPKCDFPDCKKPGICRAPKNNHLKEYFHFCEKHASDYNKNWNYYAGMTVEEIEHENKKDVYQRNPTWSFGIKGIKQEDVRQVNFHDPYDVFSKLFKTSATSRSTKNELFAPTTEMGKALKVMCLPHTFTMSELKAQYKNLVKKYHPDLSKDENEKKLKEEKFKQLLSAYKKLESYLKHSAG